MTSSKAILFVATEGSHIYHFMLPFMEMMAKRGFAVDVLASQDHTHDALMASSAIRSFYPLDLSRKPLHPKNIQAYKAMKTLLKENTYDIIHTNSPISSFLIRLAARHQTAKMVYMAHGFHFYDGAPIKNWLLYLPAEWLASHFTDELITINLEDYYRAKRHFKTCRVHYMQGTGIDLNAYTAQPVEPESTPTILCVSEFIRRKNHKQILNAIPQMVDTVPDLQVWFAGIGPLIDDCRDLADKLHIMDHTEFLGFRYDIPELINRANLIVLTSYHEGVPRCLLEAMACGKPIVATLTRGNRELILNGKNGYLVDCDDSEGLAKACIDVLHSDMEAFGRKSLEMVQPYSIDIIREKLLDIYGVVS